MNIVQQTSTVHTGYLKGRPIRYIVLHYTAGTSSRRGVARNTAAMFGNPNNRAASADYIIDDGEIVQYNGDIANRYTYAVGGAKYNVNYTPLAGTLHGKCRNNNSISIEMCSTKANRKSLAASDTDWALSAAVVDQAVELTRYLMDKYHIPADRVIMHHHVTGKLCPQPWCLNTKRLAGWEQFRARLVAGETEDDMTEAEVRKIVAEAVEKAMRDTVLALNAETAAQPEPDWSVREGWWQKAAEAGLTDGSRPESPLKRDEAAAILGRLGLIPRDGEAARRASRAAEELGME